MRRGPLSNLPVLLLLFAALLPLGAQEAEETSFYTDEPTFSLAPDASFTSRIEQEVRALEPKLGIEARFFLPLSRQTIEAPDFRLRLYNILRSVSTMEGIEYYSASRERMRTFYHDSYAVASADGEQRIPDPLVSRVPDEATVYVYQRDSSFGRNVQRLDYFYDSENILVRMENQTTMFYNGFIPLVGEENLRTYLVVEPGREGVVFYGHLAVRVGALFGMEERAQNSFYNRIKALYDWFQIRLDEEFG